MPRVKYVGGSRPGVTVRFINRPEPEQNVQVDHLHEIEVSGEERDQLLSQGDDWTEVKPSKADSKKED